MGTPLRTAPYVALVAVGSGVGAVLRLVLTSVSGGGWPTLWLVNLPGALLLGLLTGVLAGRPSGRYLAPLLGPGLLGGFTTFSSVMVLVAGPGAVPVAGPGAVLVALLQLLAMTLLGALAAWAGLALGRRGRRRPEDGSEEAG